ncbi:alpha/beta hydrolase [Jonesia quinghaiensis]|uniref:alpha/beta hydrolase n=1 Tax=Jonesia quinghaiensis TaxID=262806 RepID=UPI00040578A7|nr:alpha/beta hydrolase [Jonesia quinghaiensis]
MPQRDDWQPDVLGEGFEQLTLSLPPDDEGEVVATIVAARPSGFVHSARAVLYMHGWSDYFFHTETAAFWHAQGAAFYALDLRKYGRSLRPGQTPGYVDALAIYAADINAALEVIRSEHGPHVSVMLMGHSTGGLVASLWAHYNPGKISGLVLNSPWLELQGSSVVRTLSTPALQQLARFQPKTPLPNLDAGFYARTINKDMGGEWEPNITWRPNPAFPVRAGWLRAITAGHAKVARGLTIDVPILMLASTKTTILPRWSEDMRTSDSVLDVEVLARRAPQLGANVTINRIKDGIHDLALSRADVRAHYYERIRQWTIGYGWSG